MLFNLFWEKNFYFYFLKRKKIQIFFWMFKKYLQKTWRYDYTCKTFPCQMFFLQFFRKRKAFLNHPSCRRWSRSGMGLKIVLSTKNTGKILHKKRLKITDKVVFAFWIRWSPKQRSKFVTAKWNMRKYFLIITGKTLAHLFDSSMVCYTWLEFSKKFLQVASFESFPTLTVNLCHLEGKLLF